LALVNIVHAPDTIIYLAAENKPGWGFRYLHGKTIISYFITYPGWIADAGVESGYLDNIGACNRSADIFQSPVISFFENGNHSRIRKLPAGIAPHVKFHAYIIPVKASRKSAISIRHFSPRNVIGPGSYRAYTHKQYEKTSFHFRVNIRL
jgi:hypothetical protein